MNPTILLVDDLQMFLEIEKDFFKYAQVNLLTARDGIEALEVVKNRKPDLIFMDLQMPRMDGAQCCRAIRSDPELASTPVVLISSSSDAKDKEMSLAAGCNYFLSKPAGRDRFLEIAREFIPGINRRDHRIPCDVGAVLNVGGQAIACSLHDLGSEGAFVVTDFPGQPGNIVSLTFTLPDGSVIDSPCKIVWTSESMVFRPKGLGVKFALMPKEVKSALARYLEGKSR
ncbi:response regulator, PilZ domain-containing [Citrifermentans bemidjiense Bem]|uniref:Response regulator, PilZ domain-containing n=1 Tax=Citrifermentans bemidjiense (strain ATCC BAA-1014 / DSM 16622 / JCM 12645 / Bem) TaxID=404380 RepID=B5E8C3_CITBB|nr:response regulator [Citrifermentans bemidjiense]ACH37106.1 response regulator, PilZ domain-containing [Citrifermentans bemidjiense Bem]